jgi:alanine racemase
VCVALVEEGIELRAAGIQIPILVIGGHYARAFDELLEHRLTPVLHHVGQVEALAEALHFREYGNFPVHIKIDTGMSRLGFGPRDLSSLVTALERYSDVKVDGLMTHFACADTGDRESMLAQRAYFDEATTYLAEHGHGPRVRHMANSAAIFSGTEHHLDLVRPGISLYGVAPSSLFDLDLLPVMRVRTEVVAVRTLATGQSVGYGGTWTAQRESRIATIPMGYADGLSRSLSNRGEVLVMGRRVPLVGTISMDMSMIDVTDVPGCDIGEECIVLGQQKGVLGSDTITATEVAEHIGTIPWEVLTSVSRRVPRFYREP